MGVSCGCSRCRRTCGDDDAERVERWRAFTNWHLRLSLKHLEHEVLEQLIAAAFRARGEEMGDAPWASRTAVTDIDTLETYKREVHDAQFELKHDPTIRNTPDMAYCMGSIPGRPLGQPACNNAVVLYEMVRRSGMVPHGDYLDGFFPGADRDAPALLAQLPNWPDAIPRPPA